MNRIELSGKSQAKGRNGYFQLRSVELMNIPMDPDGQVLHFDFYPKRRVNCVGPARLLLCLEDATKLAQLFEQAVEIRPPVANIEHGELVCGCGHRGAARLEESGYQISHDLVENRRRHDRSAGLGWIEPICVGKWRRVLVGVRSLRKAALASTGAAYRLEIRSRAAGARPRR